MHAEVLVEDVVIRAVVVVVGRRLVLGHPAAAALSAVAAPLARASVAMYLASYKARASHSWR
jgi:hypothetical protein